MNFRRRIFLSLVFFLSLVTLQTQAQSKLPAITLDEYMNATGIREVRLSPDGTAVVIETESPDWKAGNFRNDLWIWTAANGLRPLTHSGSEESVEWSPDGKWIAFLTERTPTSTEAGAGASDGDDDAASNTRIWILPANGGEALPLFTESLDVHSFAWAPDSTAIYFSVAQPMPADEKAEHKEKWQDVIRWREHLKGDAILRQPLAESLAAALATPLPHEKDGKNAKSSKKAAKEKSKEADDTYPKLATQITTSSLGIAELSPSPDGKSIAFTTQPAHQRVEDPSDFELFVVAAEPKSTARQLTHNEGIESEIHWSPDGKFIHFLVHAGSGYIEGPYRDVQGRVYRLDVDSTKRDTATAKVERLGSSFDGSFENYTLLSDGRVIAVGLKSTERQLYIIDGPNATQLPGTAGAYSNLNAALKTPALLYVHSAVNDPGQAMLTTDPLHPADAKTTTTLTHFNPVFAERAQPEWRAYQWQSPDGRTVEGVLIFPPGKLNKKHLRMLTLIHGGPEDADGNQFGADWYDWATYAASHGWLVFRPNYRGSIGYGDDFELAIVPHIVSAPGLDILSGVDALVKDGFANPEKLAIGGYSYGGYMTNWLITQTDRFKAAVTGAGAVEHAANWGNDDLTFDDAWYLGGKPWENAKNYQDEAALFRFDKVKTPTHLVQGSADVRVNYLEGVTMERALESLKIPHSFLVFPGEGHGLPKNPWHGYIKVREEMKWLEKYVPGDDAKENEK